MSRFLPFAAAVLLAVPCAAAAAEPQVRTMADLRPALMRCWQPPQGSEGSELTLRFMLTHTGAVKGKPMIPYSKLTGSAEVQKQFVAAAIGTLARCTPLVMAPSFAKGFGERMMTLRLRAAPRQTAL